ncbi:MAG TPA: hypothetical protein VN639_21220, partial [Azonexus sp.]|nr:hypothetical protein [Azonexus sp.]
NAEQQAITDLAGGAGNSYAHGGFGHMSLLYETAWLKLFDSARMPTFELNLASASTGIRDVRSSASGCQFIICLI